MRKEMDEFLTELSKLTNRLGIQVGGCGCCGSPWIEPTDFDAPLSSQYPIEWNDVTKTYEYD